MKRFLTSIFFVFISLVFVHAQEESRTNQQTAIQAEFEAAARAYKAGNYAEAQQHAERALAIDPTNKQAMVFVARTIHAQYRPGNETPENVAKAYEAIAAYQRLLVSEPTHEEAYLAVTALYGAIKEDALQRQWIFQRANNSAVSAKKRADAFVLLASQDWSCAYGITEGNKQSKGTKVVRVKPEKPEDFDRLKQCITDGLSEVEQGIALDSENELAWTYKTNLLRERAKLAEMEEDKEQQAEYNSQAEIAAKKSAELSSLKKTQVQIKEEAPKTTPASKIIYSGVLNGKAKSFPAPKYPSEARAVKASGTVAVSIVVDEEGNVIEAKVISGHPLLRDAAVEAAKKAKFSPIKIEGQAVKFSGTLNYNFVYN